jgi:hypothetical protein
MFVIGGRDRKYRSVPVVLLCSLLFDENDDLFAREHHDSLCHLEPVADSNQSKQIHHE